MNTEEAKKWWGGCFEICPVCEDGIMDCDDLDTRSGEQTLRVWCEKCGWEAKLTIEIKIVEE